MLRTLEPGQVVLDVGCGRGIVVDYLRKHGVECSGVELGPVVPLPSVVNHVRSSTDAVDLPLSERTRVTTILLLDVLEHLADPPAFLARLVGAFPNLVGVIVTVPARPELWSNHDQFYGHYRRYTIPMLGEIAGVRESRYFFRALYPPLWLMAKLRVKREVALTAPRESIRWLHKIVAALFVLEYRLLPRWVAGTSIIASFAIKRYPS